MRWLVAFCILLATGAHAADYSGPISPSPFDRPIPGLRDPLDVRDPLQRAPVDPGALPDLGSSLRTDQSLAPRALPGTRTPLIVEPYDPAPQPGGPPPYWEHQPLYHAPVP